MTPKQIGDAAINEANARTAAFYENFKKALDKSTFTQKELSEKAGVSVSYVSMIVRGLREPSNEVSIRLALALDTTYEKLWKYNPQ